MKYVFIIHFSAVLILCVGVWFGKAVGEHAERSRAIIDGCHLIYDNELYNKVNCDNTCATDAECWDMYGSPHEQEKG